MVSQWQDEFMHTELALRLYVGFGIGFFGTCMPALLRETVKTTGRAHILQLWYTFQALDITHLLARGLFTR